MRNVMVIVTTGMNTDILIGIEKTDEIAFIESMIRPME